MADGSKKRVRQQIMVPFLWEDRPGLPKPDWQQSPAPAPSPHPPPSLPVKHVVTIPFKWEEKPGTPLRCFKQEPSEPNQHQQEHGYLPPPPGYFQTYDINDDVSDSSSDDYEDWDSLSDSEFEAVEVQRCESFGSVPVLMANRLIPTKAISSAVPLVIAHPMDLRVEETALASTPERSQIINNYEAASANLKGNTFLEHLFPLYPPKSGLLDKTEYSPQKVGGADKILRIPGQQHKDFDQEWNQSIAIRRPLTLGELIMLSRRRSCRRKAIQMRKQMFTRELSEKQAPGCCIFGAGNAGIAKLLTAKNLLPLKLS